MLPDLYTTDYILQPEENDSSDYGGESGQLGSGDAEEVSEYSDIDDQSSAQKMSQSRTLRQQQRGSPQVNKKRSKIGRNKLKSALSQKKSIKSANPKAEVNQSNVIT